MHFALQEYQILTLCLILLPYTPLDSPHLPHAAVPPPPPPHHIQSPQSPATMRSKNLGCLRGSMDTPAPSYMDRNSFSRSRR
jgi:hypothetical protein